MAATAQRVLHFITGKRQRPFHRLICHPPIAAVLVVIIRAVLHKDANGFWFVLAYERGIAHAATQIDVRANRTEDAGEGFGTLPRSSKSRDGAAARSADSAIVAVVRKFYRSSICCFLGLDFR